MRLVDADAVLYALVEEGQNNATKYGFRLGERIKFTPTQVDEIVDRMPTIEERKTGKWIDGYKRQTCSVCKQKGYRSWNFCPNCGSYNGGAE